MQKLRRILLREAIFCKREPSPINAKALTVTRNDILKYVQNVGQRGDLKEIVATEKILLENELEHHANSKSMISSLNIALADLANAQKLIHIVGDKKAYSHIANAYALQRNRPQGLPKDEARQAFNSHAARHGVTENSPNYNIVMNAFTEVLKAEAQAKGTY